MEGLLRYEMEFMCSWAVKLQPMSISASHVQFATPMVASAAPAPKIAALSERCLVFVSGPPLLTGYYNNHIQIFQNAGHAVLLIEMGWDARVVSLEEKPHIDSPIEQWSGDSRGYWDGNTLVVETRNFSEKVGNAKDRLLIERFAPTAAGVLEYEFTVDDQTTFTDKIVGISSMTSVEDSIYEFACHSGNYAMAGILRAGRV